MSADLVLTVVFESLESHGSGELPRSDRTLVLAAPKPVHQVFQLFGLPCICRAISTILQCTEHRAMELADADLTQS